MGGYFTALVPQLLKLVQEIQISVTWRLVRWQGVIKSRVPACLDCDRAGMFSCYHPSISTQVQELLNASHRNFKKNKRDLKNDLIFGQASTQKWDDLLLVNQVCAGINCLPFPAVSWGNAAKDYTSSLFGRQSPASHFSKDRAPSAEKTEHVNKAMLAVCRLSCFREK